MDELNLAKHAAAALPFLVSQINDSGEMKITVNTKRIWESVLTVVISSAVAGGLSIWTLAGKLDERVSNVEKTVTSVQTDVRDIRNFLLNRSK